MRFNAIWPTGRVCAFAAAFLSAGAAQASTIVSNFSGLSLNVLAPLNGGSYAPPDTDGAIGANHFVQFINGGYQVYDRNGTAVGDPITDATFWRNAGASSALINQGLSDTRIKFDVNSQHWFTTEITVNCVNTTCQNNSVLIGVSNTANPLDGWKSTSLNVSGSGRFNDYDTLNVDANAIYIGTNDFNATGTAFTGVTFTSIPKISLLLGIPSTAGSSTFLQNTTAPSLGFTPQGITNDGTGYSGTNIIGISATAFNQVQITPLNNTGGAGASLGASMTKAIAFDGGPTDVRQPDGSRVIDPLDDRFSGTIYQVGNLIYAANTVNNSNRTGGGTAPGQDAIHWLIIDATTKAIVNEGLITDGFNDLWQPSISANANGDIVIGYNKAGAGLNISSFASVGHTVGGVVTFENPILLKTSSVSNYRDGFGSPVRWGDYSTTMVDPIDPNTFWTIQEVANDSLNWGTQISAINVAPVPEPSTWAMLFLGFGMIGCGMRRRSRVRARVSYA